MPTTEEYVSAVRSVMKCQSAWVLFSHGTFVVIDKPQADKSVADQALEAMEVYGEVMAGGPPGDFNVVRQDNGDAVITGHCPYMYTMVLKAEMEEKQLMGDIMTGMYGRSKRQKDFHTHEIVHTEPASN